MGYLDVMMMPYNFFIKSLEWKNELENEKRKRFEEKVNKTPTKTFNKPMKLMR